MVALNIRPPAHETRAGRRPGKRQRMWSAIRQLRMFDPQKIALCTESTDEDARRFIAALRRTGYVVKINAHLSRLVRDTGPRAPVMLWNRGAGISLGGMLDRNTGVAYGIGGKPAPPVSAETRQGAGISKMRLTSRRRRKAASMQSGAAQRLAELLRNG